MHEIDYHSVTIADILSSPLREAFGDDPKFGVQVRTAEREVLGPPIDDFDYASPESDDEDPGPYDPETSLCPNCGSADIPIEGPHGNACPECGEPMPGGSDMSFAVDDEMGMDEDSTLPSPGTLSPPLPGQMKQPPIGGYGERTNVAGPRESVMLRGAVDDLYEEIVTDDDVVARIADLI